VAEFVEIPRRGRHAPLVIGGDVHEVDMTDFAKIDYAALFATVRVQLEQTGGES